MDHPFGGSAKLCLIFRQLVIQINKFMNSLGLNTLHSLVFVLYLKLLMLCVIYRDMCSAKIVGFSE